LIKKIADVSYVEFGFDDNDVGGEGSAKKIKARNDALKCNCLQGCASLSYEPTTFQSKIAWEQLLNETHDGTNTTKEVTGMNEKM
jgi:hypothetical protein